MSEKPSYLTSTTALGFLLTVIGALVYAGVYHQLDLLLKLVDMIVPAYIGVKGFQMATQNGHGAEPVPPAPPGP